MLACRACDCAAAVEPKPSVLHRLRLPGGTPQRQRCLHPGGCTGIEAGSLPQLRLCIENFPAGCAANGTAASHTLKAPHTLKCGTSSRAPCPRPLHGLGQGHQHGSTPRNQGQHLWKNKPEPYTPHCLRHKTISWRVLACPSDKVKNVVDAEGVGPAAGQAPAPQSGPLRGQQRPAQRWRRR